jgi:hypothetical protein
MCPYLYSSEEEDSLSDIEAKELVCSTFEQEILSSTDTAARQLTGPSNSDR